MADGPRAALAAAALAPVFSPSRAVSAEPLWVLLGNRHGDNRQLLAIADALGRPYRPVQLRFGPGARLPLARWFAQRFTWRTDPPLSPPWPRAVLAAGRKSVPAALWIRRASGGQTRLVHVNRPWAPLAWFDLVVTTPQYALPERDNVLVNLLPFVPPVVPAPLPASFAARAAALPRPWTVVLVGGNSRPFVLDQATAAALAATVNADLRSVGGSASITNVCTSGFAACISDARHQNETTATLSRRSAPSVMRNGSERYSDAIAVRSLP